MVLMPRTCGYAPVYGRRHPADVIQLSILGRGDGPRLSLEPNVVTGSSSREGRRGSKRDSDREARATEDDVEMEWCWL